MKIHESYGTQAFENKACFLCGENMDDNFSVEHVFPKWIQTKYDLWDQKIELLNGSLIPYRQMKIPCCKPCNNQHLSIVENEITALVNGGYEEAVLAPENWWYLWSGKIFYGILRKELSMLSDRSNPSKGTILTRKFLESFSNFHLFMQGFRGRHKFIGMEPYSVLICNLHVFDSSYDFRDNLYLSTLAIRLGNIGIIVSFEDGGLIRDSYGRYVDEVNGRKLHPIQFYELYAKVNYQLKLRQRPVSYVTQSHIDGQGTATTEMVRSSTELDEWNQKDFCTMLRFQLTSILNNPAQVEFAPPDRVSSWMTDNCGNILLLSREEWESNYNRYSTD